MGPTLGGMLLRTLALEIPTHVRHDLGPLTNQVEWPTEIRAVLHRLPISESVGTLLRLTLLLLLAFVKVVKRVYLLQALGTLLHLSHHLVHAGCVVLLDDVHVFLARHHLALLHYVMDLEEVLLLQRSAGLGLHFFGCLPVVYVVQLFPVYLFLVYASSERVEGW